MPKLIVALLMFLNLLPVDKLSLRAETEAKKRYIKVEQSQDVNQTAIRVQPAPGQTGNDIFSSGRANISIDLATGKTINSHEPDKKLQIASLTKLMTAYLALKDLPLEKTVSVPKLEIHDGDSVMGLVEGEKINVLDLVKGLLINSGSDSAQTLAIADSGSLQAFISKMNVTARDLGLNNTHYSNPVGWDDGNNYSTAIDVANLSRVLLGNQTFREIIQKRTENVKTGSGRIINLTNTNVLLTEPGFIGVKTGYTPGAGECLVSLNKKDNHEVLTVILGSADRFGQTRLFLGWIYDHFSW